MRLLTAVLLGTLLFTSCQASRETAGSKEQKVALVSDKKEEKILREVFKPLSSQGVELKEISKVSSPKVPCFDTYRVTFLDKRRGREISKYVFLTSDGKYLVLDVFSISEKDGKLEIKQLRPAEPVKSVKVDLSWLKEVEKELDKEGVPHVIGKSDRKVYIVWDVFCPFCYKHFSQIEEIAKKNGIEMHMIPLAVHGKDSIKGLVYYTFLAKEKGTAEAFRELYSLGNGDFGKYVKALKDKLAKDYSGYPEKERQKLEKFFKELRTQLLKRNVHATPTIIYIPPGSGEKGYVIVGFKPIDQVLKMK